MIEIEYVIIFVLCAIIVVQIYISRVERKELYDRIQSGSLSEYKASNDTIKSKSNTRHEMMLKKWRHTGSDSG